jgi:hypothetical protein
MISYLHNKCFRLNYTDRGALTGGEEVRLFPALASPQPGSRLISRCNSSEASHVSPPDARNIHRDGAAAHRFFFFDSAGSSFFARFLEHFAYFSSGGSGNESKKIVSRRKKILIHHIS